MKLILKEFRSLFWIGVGIEILFALFLAILLFRYNPHVITNFRYDSESFYQGYLYENWFYSSLLFLTPLLGILIGITVMSKDVAHKTIALLFIKPISRRRLITYKFISGIVAIIILLGLPNIFIYIFSLCYGETIPSYFISTSMLYVSLLISLFYALTFFLANLTRLTSFPLIISLMLWITCLYAFKNSNAPFNKLLPLHLIEKRNLIISNEINFFEILYWLSLIIVFYCASYAVFKKRDVE